jgi:hypothetical protein
MYYNKYKNMYLDFLPFFMLSTTTIGFISGVISCNSYKPNDFFCHMVGYSSVGVITGLSYPISFPLLGCYVLFKNNK